MAKKSKLLLALDAHKGRDYGKERQKKLAKTAEKRKKEKRTRAENENEDRNDLDANLATEMNDSDIAGDIERINESEERIGDEKMHGGEDEDEEQESFQVRDEDDNLEEDEEGDDIPLSDLSGDERTDVIPHQRLTINNSAAINACIKRISFITAKTPFSEHNSLVSSEPIDVPDPNDDLSRELAFYKVCQAAAISAQKSLKKEGVLFSRPGDYFAEMVKSDEHMSKIKKQLYEEAAAKKAAADARRQRDLKKFGKQVQIAKLQQRQKEKRETLEKINSLKRKRKTDHAGPTEDEDLFDVAIEEASRSDLRTKKSVRSSAKSDDGPPSLKRQKKNEKYGFGGKKRFSKSGDAISSSDLRGFSTKKMKEGRKNSNGVTKRLGRSRRKAMKT